VSPAANVPPVNVTVSDPTAAIITDKSFILINAPDPIPMAAMEDFVNSFRPSR
jgi:hypothetical protein